VSPARARYGLAVPARPFEHLPAPRPEDLLVTYPDLDAEFVDAYERVLPYTMTSPERMFALWQGVRHVERRAVPGAFVECGVWRGGSSMLMAHALPAPRRELWLYDTFSGMPAPTEQDVDFTGRSAEEQLRDSGGDRDNLALAYASLEEVQSNMARTGHPADRVHYVPGFVEDTIPERAPARIALLRLDTDWESSTRHELEHLWPRLSVGGVLVIDDYGHWAGARKAVDEYFAGRDDAPLLTRVDYTGRVGVRVV
jgi:predicted O-methyltransferase YrrM